MKRVYSKRRTISIYDSKELDLYIRDKNSGYININDSNKVIVEIDNKLGIVDKKTLELLT